MKRIPRNVLVAGVAAVLFVGLGAAGAIAASGVLSPEEESKAIIDDAAAQLGVEPSQLSAALEQALRNRIDAAVEAGQLTEEQGKVLKEKLDSGDFPLLGRPFYGGPGFHGHGPGLAGRGEVFAAAASYLGLTEAELREQLDDQTLAEVAKEEGKSVSGLVDAMVAAASTSIDQAVEDGKLTKEQGSRLKDGLEARLTDLVNGELEERPGFHGRSFGDMDDGPMGRHGLFEGPPA
jgi:polyhydroxyalkanoate synthesis regulator phasin